MRFQTRHFTRDEHLPQARKQLLDHAIEILQQKKEIIGIFLGGSLANGTDDLFSDIDLRIVVTDVQYDVIVQNKKQLAYEFGDVLFFEQLNSRSPYVIAHYANFIKIDLFIYTFSHLKPSIWLKGIKIIHDSYGKLNEILHLSNKIEYEVTEEEVKRWEGKVLAYVHEVYRRVMREEYIYALTMINHLKSFIVKGWNMEAERHSNDVWNWSNVEGNRSPLERWQLTMLRSWNSDRDQAEIMKTLYSMIPEIKRLHNVLTEKVGIKDNRDHFRRALNMVI